MKYRCRLPSVIMLLILLLSGLCCNNPDNENLPPVDCRHESWSDDAVASYAAMGYRVALNLPVRQFPWVTDVDGRWVTVDQRYWTSGFFPGILWLLHEQTGDDFLLHQARMRTDVLAETEFLTTTHDLGFMFVPSFGAAWRLQRRDEDLAHLRNAASSLATRFNDTVGCLRSWDGGSFQVIIDSLLNLELLFLVARETNDQQLWNIGWSHAERVRREHIRPDGSTWHVVDFNPDDGSVMWKGTSQGYSDDSTWSRGQAWAILGFAIAFRETDDEYFLDAARITAAYFMSRVSRDAIPLWDFDVPENDPRQFPDSSASAIAATGLLCLADLTPDAEERQLCLEQADMLLEALCNKCLQPTPWSILQNSSGNIPDGRPFERDTAVIWGEYYLLQALSQRMTK